MTHALDQSISELLDASRDDVATMQFPVNDRTFGFHAQQAIEKLIKALIAGHGEKFEFTHDLRSLVEDVTDLGEQLPVDLILVQSLTNYAGVWRIKSRSRSRSRNGLHCMRPSIGCTHMSSSD